MPRNGPTVAAAARAQRNSPLRRRIARSALGITGLALLLFALPLAVAVQQLYRGQQLARLQQDATRMVALVPDNPITAGSRLAVPGDVSDQSLIGIYTPAGDRVGGAGPLRSRTAAAARDAGVHRGDEAGQLAVAVPVSSDRATVAVIRAAVPADSLWRWVAGSWAAMAALAAAVLAVAAVLSRRQGRRIAQPLERLTEAARALGEGDFTVTAVRSGITEADQASAALAATATRLGRLLERERAFSADASHQLRTPLTGLILGLESALQRPGADLHAATRDAVARGVQLQRTIEDLLRLARDTPPSPRGIDLLTELETAELSWGPTYADAGRTLLLNVPQILSPVRGSCGAVRQILGVLLDNALRHGSGTVSVTAVDMDDAIAVDIGDQGPGLTGDPETVFVRRARGTDSHGIGLPLARSLAEADGGRLFVHRACPAPIFTLLLPAADSAQATTTAAPAANDPSRNGNRDPAPS